MCGNAAKIAARRRIRELRGKGLLKKWKQVLQKATSSGQKDCIDGLILHDSPWDYGLVWELMSSQMMVSSSSQIWRCYNFCDSNPGNLEHFEIRFGVFLSLVFQLYQLEF